MCSTIKCPNSNLEYRRKHIGSEIEEQGSQMDVIMCFSCIYPFFNLFLYFFNVVLSLKLRIVLKGLHLGACVNILALILPYITTRTG